MLSSEAVVEVCAAKAIDENRRAWTRRTAELTRRAEVAGVRRHRVHQRPATASMRPRGDLDRRTASERPGVRPKRSVAKAGGRGLRKLNGEQALIAVESGVIEVRTEFFVDFDEP